MQPMEPEPPASVDDATVGDEYMLDTVVRSEDELEAARNMKRWRDPRRARQKPPVPEEDLPVLESPSS